jgi:hypothetical protein|tara:strand:+ start:486 stop:656 length:171 start_codon:yes stop_codon:yes gene_type:complete
MVIIKIKEATVDLIRNGECLHTWIHHRQFENIQAAHDTAEEEFPFDEVDVEDWQDE